jgi:hypothetical protein
MPITPYLNGRYFDPETKRIMGVAFEMTRVAMRLPRRTSHDATRSCAPITP